MNPYTAEFIGTAAMMLIGNGVVANALLKGTKGNNAGLVVITIAWGLAVFCGVIIAGPYSGAHLNPAISLANVVAGRMGALQGLLYAAAQIAGAMLGATLVYLFYKDHYDITDDGDAKLGTFCTGPAIRNLGRNCFSEFVGTFVLVFVIFSFGAQGNTASVGAGVEALPLGLGSLGALPVALLVIAIGMALGGTTGYAINPARDLGPRIMHALLPIRNKRSSDWPYAWVPVAAPAAGAVVAAVVYLLLNAEV